jgi:hypothetical protein
MPLAILVVDRDTAVEQLGEPGRIELLGKPDREQGLGLVEQEAAVAIGARDHRGPGGFVERQRAAFDRFGACEQFIKRGCVEPVEDQHLGAREQGGVELERRILGSRAD